MSETFGIRVPRTGVGMGVDGDAAGQSKCPWDVSTHDVTRIRGRNKK